MNKRTLLFITILVLFLAGVPLLLQRSGIGKVALTADTGVEARTLPALTPGKTTAPALMTMAPEQKALATLIDILASKNDNDPRLDRDFNQLSADDKLAFQQHYRKLAAEKRNERGTIVFLLGRNLTAVADFGFLQEVLTEPACLSLADCSREERRDDRGNHEDHADHYGADRELTLAYPQVVAIKSVERALEQTGNAELTNAALATLHTAQNSRIPTVARLAGKVHER